MKRYIFLIFLSTMCMVSDYALGQNIDPIDTLTVKGYYKVRCACYIENLIIFDAYKLDSTGIRKTDRYVIARIGDISDLPKKLANSTVEVDARRFIYPDMLGYFTFKLFKGVDQDKVIKVYRRKKGRSKYRDSIYLIHGEFILNYKVTKRCKKNVAEFVK